MSKKHIPDESIQLLKRAVRTKLGISTAKPKKKAKKREEEEEVDDDPPPRKQKAERLGFAEMVDRKQ